MCFKARIYYVCIWFTIILWQTIVNKIISVVWTHSAHLQLYFNRSPHQPIDQLFSGKQSIGRALKVVKPKHNRNRRPTESQRLLNSLNIICDLRLREEWLQRNWFREKNSSVRISKYQFTQEWCQTYSRLNQNILNFSRIFFWFKETLPIIFEIFSNRLENNFYKLSSFESRLSILNSFSTSKALNYHRPTCPSWLSTTISIKPSSGKQGLRSAFRVLTKVSFKTDSRLNKIIFNFTFVSQKIFL